MQRSLSAAQYFGFMVSNLTVLKDTADTAMKFHAADTYVGKVQVINPYLERTAPVADELAALIKAGAKTRTTPAELKRKIIYELMNDAAQRRDFSEHAFPRDQKWLEAGRKFFTKFVLPILLDQLQQQLLGSREMAAE